MVGFIEEHRDTYGVEPICTELATALLQYFEAKRGERESDRAPVRPQRDAQLMTEMRSVHAESGDRYDARKPLKELQLKQWQAARCTTDRLMHKLGLQGVRHGPRWKATVAGEVAVKPLDRVDRQFEADHPDQLWAADSAYLPIWQGMVYVAFILDVYSRRIGSWRVAKHMRTDLVLSAPEQAIWF